MLFRSARGEIARDEDDVGQHGRARTRGPRGVTRMKLGVRHMIFGAVVLAIPVSSWFLVFRPQNREIRQAENELELKNLTLAKLREGQTLRILAWGDSVTEVGRYQPMFLGSLRTRFPRARIELRTEAWPGKSTVDYLAEPPGGKRNFAEKILSPRPDLILTEFVNDASLRESPGETQTRYERIREAFLRIGAEWILFTPHYVKPDWMGLDRQRDIDEDPRSYVRFLREFARDHGLALADASRRYGRLWRQGIPYLTLMENGINHPNLAGHQILADSLLALFPGSCP